MKTRSDNIGWSMFLMTCAGLSLFFSSGAAVGYAGNGPGTMGSHIPQSVATWDYNWSNPINPLFPASMPPGVRHALGGCVDSEGNSPNSPIEYNMRLVTNEDTTQAWLPGETRRICVELRSSSLRWVRNPPKVELILIGGNGRDFLWGPVYPIPDVLDGTSNTFFVGERDTIVPDFPTGSYKFFAYDYVTGLCTQSDFTIKIEGGTGTTPTPTPTQDGGVTPTPTPTMDTGGETPTPTPTIGPPTYVANSFLRDIGPGTTGRRISSTKIKTFICPSDSDPIVSTMSPGILNALGLCRDEMGNRPNAPIEYDVKIRLDDGIYQREFPTWGEGSQHWIHLVARSSSIQFVTTPPEFHLYLVGSAGDRAHIAASNIQRRGGCASYQVGEDPFLFTVPADLPGGLYRIQAVDKSVGLCISSQQAFYIPPGSGGGPTPTPTPGASQRMPDYDNDNFVNGIDAPEFLSRLAMSSEEANIDGIAGTSFRDIFMFALWWQRSELDN